MTYDARHRNLSPAATQRGRKLDVLARNGRGVVHTPRHNAALRTGQEAA